MLKESFGNKPLNIRHLNQSFKNKDLLDSFVVKHYSEGEKDVFKTLCNLISEIGVEKNLCISSVDSRS